jgi:hypothetical protein
MNAGFRNSRSAGLFQATLVSTLVLLPMVSHAQVFFGSGGSTNTAPTSTNLAFGAATLASNTTGLYNTAIGVEALRSNNTGNFNTANGALALFSNTSGSFNSANGLFALGLNSTGYNNTANGAYALGNNTSGFYNTASGTFALYSNSTGFDNTANGYHALFHNTAGYNNTANGYEALYNNMTGYNNTANGVDALNSNTTGSYNIANGYLALDFNITGSQNTANGNQALYLNTDGNYNTANGNQALYNNQGHNNTALGNGAGENLTTGNSNIAIGNPGVAGESGAIRIGTMGLQASTYIAGINGVTVSSGAPVFINANGQLGTITSSRRFKNAIKDMGTVTDRLMKLRPVTFRYKDSAEQGPHALQYGLIAEEVAKVYPDLVQYDKAGKPFTIYYHLLTPMLLNELQKAHHRFEAQKTEITAMKTAYRAEITNLKSEMALLKQSQQQQLNALAKLNALVETSQGKSQLQRAVFIKR